MMDDFHVTRHDHERELRNGFSEVIFCEGKEPEHLLRVIEEMKERGHNVFGTRASKEVLSLVASKNPEAKCDATSRTFRMIQRPIEALEGNIAVLCAGTADIPVAEEALHTANFFGVEARRFYDVGVAGIHRVMSCVDELKKADCAIVVAGMEGALPSVVGGLVSIPVIACPTSIGYGANFQGIAALLGMLNSCSEGVTVVNIDNGFGAACAALRILRTMKERK
jgi:NCAIR mutase (PurE)-related protein